MAGTKLKQVGREEERFGKDGETSLFYVSKDPPPPRFPDRQLSSPVGDYFAPHPLSDEH